MKKIFGLVAVLAIAFFISGCDIIQEEIDRIESIELEDFAVDIPDQSILLKITSNADEQVIEAVNINDTEYDLISQGDDWYLLEEVPIAKNYDIGDVYYRSGIGMRLTFAIDFQITLDEAIDEIPDDLIEELLDVVQIDAFTISQSDDELAVIESDEDFIIEELADWAWLILVDDDTPVFVVFEHNDVLYVVEPPEDADEFIED